ncbi:tripartite tricarboxylate transporter permease, partial [Thermodesulfobacteriota bacterium]
PMSQAGMSGRAIGIVETASGLGGIFGAVVLALIIPAIRPIVISFQSPECLMLVFMGICFIAILGQDSPGKGLVAGGLGLLLSLVGLHEVSGVPRYTFGTLYLWDGIRLVPLALGLFAIPEVVKLITTGGTIATVKEPLTAITSDVLQGIKDVFQHWWLFLRCAFIGTLVGIIPGVGGAIAVFVAYGHAKQTSKHPERFGTGCVEGIIAPESANDAKEGGSLVPTLAFGIPGSAGMAVLLGALLVLGLQPGPAFLKEHLDLTFTLVGTIVLANIMGSIICLLLATKMAKIAFVPGQILAPLILSLIAIGSYSIADNIMDVFAAFILGGFGYALMKFDYSRPSLFLGFVLGSLAETYFHLSLMSYGWRFILKPVALVLLIITVLSIFSKPIGTLLRRLRRV